MIDSLEIKPILRLISELPEDLQKRLVLIGGQAIAFWGDYFLQDQLTLAQEAALTSSDLDIAAGSVEGVRLLAASWKGTPHFPKPGDLVPNMAVIHLNRPGFIKGSDFVIDVMNTVYGQLDADKMRTSSTQIEWDIDRDGRNIIHFNVLNPPTLLWSRIANLKHRRMSQVNTERELIRTKVLCKIVREDLWNHAIEIMSDPDSQRKALNYAKYVYKNISRHKDTRSVLADHPSLILPFQSTIPDSDFWPENFMRGVGVWQGRLLRHVDKIIRNKDRRAAIRKL
ncbi:hypothetical protein [Vreelandella malpeensis]|uniref:Nucleotidyl transferase AbiEii/AbiGii toxin family protein n=1 Tax=Vreelandella malpeensis TaxID=1172368 RepID=A0ABS8DMZ5_9GAMM|nr:hypothetical protein [Halomonas malpeensis]MCB8887667.1 hypothetical protein [Halomonas malpeensis]